MAHLKTYGIMALLGLALIALDKRNMLSFLNP
jgi:hypothetical protein